MIGAFSESCSSLIDRLKEATSNPDGTGEIDAASELHILTSDVIARTAFGSSYEDGKKLFDLQKEQCVLVIEAYNSIYFPGLRLIRLFIYINLRLLT